MVESVGIASAPEAEELGRVHLPSNFSEVLSIVNNTYSKKFLERFIFFFD